MLWLGVSLGEVVFAQTLRLNPSAAQYVSVAAVASAAAVAPGGRVTLWAEGMPKANIHVYASGAKDFTPVALVMTPRQGVTFSRPAYPPSELSPTAGIAEQVPVYRKAFRIAQPVTVGGSVKVGETITIGGAVNYQACDDRVCYPTASIPVLWTVLVK